MQVNRNCKKRHELELYYKCYRDKFINVSISSIGISANFCDTFSQMHSDLYLDNEHLHYFLMKLTSAIIRTTYFIFCMHNKSRTDPESLALLSVKPYIG